VHVTLSVLGLPFTEHIVDLSVPRTAEYLAINPRGKVPSMIYNGENIRESAVIAQFLADSHPSYLMKTSNEPGGALQRARINFFADTFKSIVIPKFMGAICATAEGAKVEATAKMVDVIVAELEPLLKDANPFFGGAENITLAEVCFPSCFCT
jgi:glutathione S-transferase